MRYSFWGFLGYVSALLLISNYGQIISDPILTSELYNNAVR
jgi:hypothetical protein